MGKLYVGSCESALQWAGQHVGNIKNVPTSPTRGTRSAFASGKTPLTRTPFDGVAWENRMITAVKLVLVALMFGEGVLLHCRQGRHCSGAFRALIMVL